MTDRFGGLPLLAPMSEVAGRMAIQAGAHALELDQGGRGMLLGGVSVCLRLRVVVIGGGVVGTNAAHDCHGRGSACHGIGQIDSSFAAVGFSIRFENKYRFSTVDTLEEHVSTADLVIGAVLVPGGRHPSW